MGIKNFFKNPQKRNYFFSGFTYLFMIWVTFKSFSIQKDDGSFLSDVNKF
jgi:hypothetical protein